MMMGIQQVFRSWKESFSSGDWKQDECVKVEAMKGSEVEVDEKKCTPVMVRVTAAPWRPRLRTAMDVVVVLDVSSSMKAKMEEMKEAVKVVIDNLGPDNKLSLVLFDKQHRVVMDLTHMTRNGRLEATTVIGNWLSTVTTARDEFCNQSVADALGAADKILTGRSRPEGDGRLGCIMLLSGGENKDISTSSLDELNFPVHTFGLGADHEARSFRCIASKTAGTYSFISNGKTTDAFKAFIGGLTSVAATSVKISIKAQAGVNISSIVTGSLKKVVHQIEEECHDIQIDEMYAGETKNFIVYLQSQSAEAIVSSATTAEKLVAIKGSYQQGCLLPGKEITVTHDSSLGATGSNIVAPAVAAELVRVKLVNQVTAMVEREDTNLDLQELKRAWEAIKVSTGCQELDADSVALSELEKDVAEMTNAQGLPYMLSWLSCHQWQRATTMSHHSCAYFKVRTPSTWGRTFTLVCGSVFLFALMLVMLLWLGIFGGLPGPNMIEPTALDIKGHPNWPTMKGNLVDLLDKTKQGEITSFFQDQKASSHDMNLQIDRYLDMAIVHAAVLRARYEGTAADDISEKVVRHQAEVYLHSMLKRTKQYALPSMKGASIEDVAGEMSRYLYSTIVQTNVLVTIRKPPVPGGPDKDEKIRKLEELVIKLRMEITTLRNQKDNCCRGAIKCRKQVEELGGSVDVDETFEVITKVYYDEVKEISSLK